MVFYVSPGAHLPQSLLSPFWLVLQRNAVVERLGYQSYTFSMTLSQRETSKVVLYLWPALFLWNKGLASW